MADITGTNGNDVFFFQGDLEQLTLFFFNPYTDETFFVDEEKNVNTSSYEGLAGIDTLFMTNFGDAIFLRNPHTNEQMVFNVEVFFAGDGGDIIHLADTQYTLGNITADGGSSDDIIFSNIGNDTLNGREGDDIMDGGPGNDRLNGGSGNGINSGNDRLNGGAGADYLNAEDGNDILQYFVDGQFGNQFMAHNIGSPGVPGTEEFVNVGGTNLSLDVFNGGAGYDILKMTGGNDTLFLDDPYHDFHPQGSSLRLINVEQIDAGAGDDVIDLTHATLVYGDIIMNGEGGNDHLWSSAGNDLLNGGDGNDHLFGGFGNDELNGDAGDDTLYGSLGNDLLRGGDGNDILYGGASSNSQYVVITEHTYTFENTVVFPNLVERTNILDLVPPGDNALGVAAGNLSVDYATTATLTFHSTGAGYDNSLGYYNIALDGTIQSVKLAFPNVKNFATGSTATIDLPGAPDTDFGFFIIANGANKNNDFSNYDLVNGDFKFIYNHGQAGERLANINDNASDIKLVYTNGATEKVVVGSNNHIYHTTARDGATNLNPDGEVHVVSGVIDNTMAVMNPDNFDIKGNMTSVTKNGITVSIGDPLDPALSTGKLSWVDTADGSGIGIKGNGSDKVFKAEVLSVAFQQAAENVTLTIADVGANNLNSGIDYKIYLVGDMDNPILGEFDLGTATPQNGLVDIVLNAADYGAGAKIAKIDVFSIANSSLSKASFMLNNVAIQTGEEGTENGTLRIGFEDLPNLGDADYNDVVFDITVAKKTEIVLLENDGDMLFGGAGDDIIDGGIGDDLIMGGEGADTLYGDQGADLFLFQSIAEAGDMIMDFETGAGGDILNLTDVLEGFDPLQDDINAFLQLADNGGNTDLNVNVDGQGNDFITLATFNGGLGGATLADLLASGNLVTDQSIPV